MSDTLTEIMAWKRQEIAPFMREVSRPEWTSFNAMAPKPPSFAGVLRRDDGKRAVIAEIKRRSSAAGAIATGIAATDQAINYRAADASALSILADEKFLGVPLKTSVPSPRFSAKIAQPSRACARTLWCIRSRWAHLIFWGLCSDRFCFCPNGAPSSSSARCSGSRSRPGRAGARRSLKSFADASNGTARCLKTEMRPIEVLQAREAGASAILIVVRALNDAEIAKLFEAAKLGGLDRFIDVSSGL